MRRLLRWPRAKQSILYSHFKLAAVLVSGSRKTYLQTSPGKLLNMSLRFKITANMQSKAWKLAFCAPISYMARLRTISFDSSWQCAPNGAIFFEKFPQEAWEKPY